MKLFPARIIGHTNTATWEENNEKIIEPLHECENWENEVVWLVIGRKKPTVKKRETADEYEAHFYALVAKYKTRENPPSDDEKD